MWPFKKKKPSEAVDPSRYQANPINLFFEDLIIDILEKLPAERSSAIQAMNLQKVFSTQASHWKSAVRETLHLSDTFDVAVWDLWVRNCSHYEDSAAGYRHFAQNFADMYMADDSKVDVWAEGALDAAKVRVAAFRKNA